MKKIVIIGLIFIVNMLSFFSFYDFKFKPFVIADESKKFAQVQKDNVHLFFKPNGEICFELPKSYYVELLANVDENGFYKARYLEKVGYVKKSDIQCVASAPQKTFLSDVNFRILASQSAELRSEPSRDKGISTLICELELYETNFVYYGKREGEEVVPKRGNIWYYCSYVKGGVEKQGYVYAGLIDQMKEFDELEINSSPIDAHNWVKENATIQENKNLSIDMPNSSQVAIIVGISIPALLLLLALFRPIKVRKVIKNKAIKEDLKTQNRETQKSNIITIPKPKKQSRAEKGKDFYELK